MQVIINNYCIPLKCRVEIEGENESEEQLVTLLDKQDDTFPHIMINLNNKLALQNSLWAKLKK